MEKRIFKQLNIIAVLLILAGAASMVCGCTANAGNDSGSAPVVSAAAQADAPPDSGENTSALSGIPDTFTQEELVLSDGRLNVRIDAEVVKPDTDRIPLAKLTAKEADDATKGKWLNFLADGKQLYHARSEEELLQGQAYSPISPEDYSKEEITEIIAYLKSGNYLEYLQKDPEKYYMASIVATEIEMWEGFYDAAPEVAGRRAFDGDLSGSFFAEVDLGRVKPATIGILTGPHTSGDDIALVFENVNTGSTGGAVVKIDELDETKPDMPVGEAQKLAEQTIAGLGFTDFELSAAGLTPDDDRNVLEVESGIMFTRGFDAMPKSYIFYFSKAVGGMHETYANWFYRDIGNERPWIWNPEYASVMVSDAGVQSVSYRNTLSDAEIIESNVDVIGLDEAAAIFSEQVAENGVWTRWGDDDQEKDALLRKITIDRIELGGMRIARGGAVDRDSYEAAGGSVEEYIFTPVWSFFGNVTEQWAPGTGDTNQLDENNEFHYTELGQCILTINAVDGSVVERF